MEPEEGFFNITSPALDRNPELSPRFSYPVL
jgi:hypothetical protein